MLSLVSITYWFLIIVHLFIHDRKTDLVLFVYRAPDFSVAKFDERTVMLCDQVGALPFFAFVLIPRFFSLLIFKCLFLFSVKGSIMLVVCGTAGYVI